MGSELGDLVRRHDRAETDYHDALDSGNYEDAVEFYRDLVGSRGEIRSLVGAPGGNP